MDILGMDVRKKMDKGKKNQVKELFHHDTPLKRLYIYARVRLFVTLIELCWTCQDSVMFRKRKRILIRGIINRKYVHVNIHGRQAAKIHTVIPISHFSNWNSWRIHRSPLLRIQRMHANGPRLRIRGSIVRTRKRRGTRLD